MHHAVLRQESPYQAAVLLNSRLFSTDTVPLGCEHSLQTGPAPCGLSVDAERARFLRRGAVQMWSSKGTWEARPTAEEEGRLSELYVQDDRPRTQAGRAQDAAAHEHKWVPAVSHPGFLQRFGSGPLCRLTGPPKRYGRELHLGRRGGDGTLVLSLGLRRLLGVGAVSAQELHGVVLERLPNLTEGGIPVALLPRGDQLFVQLDFSSIPQKGWRDSSGRLLLAPPTRRVLPEPCAGCPQKNWCETVTVTHSAAHAWRELGLTHPDGTPTRRGIIFSFFQHGEGLAIAAALEDPEYALEDLVFDLADLRGGPRFAEEDGQAHGRLGLVCQRTYRNADHPGYLEFGIPTAYSAGASEVIRGIIQYRRGRQEFLTETLRLGDVERALLEWNSLLRHVANAPAHQWKRWEDFQSAAKSYSAAPTSP